MFVNKPKEHDGYTGPGILIKRLIKLDYLQFFAPVGALFSPDRKDWLNLEFLRAMV